MKRFNTGSLLFPQTFEHLHAKWQQTYANQLNITKKVTVLTGFVRPRKRQTQQMAIAREQRLGEYLKEKLLLNCKNNKIKQTNEKQNNYFAWNKAIT